MKNTIKLSLIAMALASISACGGGGGSDSPAPAPQPPTPPPPPTIETGTFGRTAIVGVKYQTPTQSGVTDASGQFSYIAGETVTFSIGNITLGSSAGDANITLQDFYSLPTLPTSLTTIRKQLRDDASTDFDALVNLASFVASLDNNQSIEDGINISQWETPLASADLRFDLPAGLFRSKTFPSFMFTHNISENRYAQALSHLYTSQGLAVLEFEELSLQVLDTQGGETRKEQSTRSFNEQGSLLTFERLVDNENDGINDITLNQTSEYDDNENEISRITRFDNDADGLVDRVTDLTRIFNENGNFTSVVTNNDNDGNGTIDSINTIAATYNEQNLRESEIRSVDSNADGSANSITTTSFTYNAQGQVTQTSAIVDRNADGNPEQIQNQENTYTEFGEFATRITEIDNDGDGIFDSCSAFTFTYNAHNLEEKVVFENDSACDDVIESVTTSSKEYSENRDVLLDKRVDEFNVEGVIRSNVTSIVRTFDANGRELTILSEQDSGNDELDVDFSRTTITYNEAGLIQSRVNERGSDDVIANIRRESFEYNQNGDVISEVDERFGAELTTPFSIVSDIYTYDEFGNALSVLTTSDTNNDGEIERSIERTTQYAQFSLEFSQELVLRTF